MLEAKIENWQLQSSEIEPENNTQTSRLHMSNISFLFSPHNFKNYFWSAAIMLCLFLCSPGNANSEHFENTMASVWVKMATVWLCFAIYLWTLLAPLILGNCRDFGYESDWREGRERQLLHKLNATFIHNIVCSVFLLCCSKVISMHVIPCIPAYCAI